ncbi:MAG: hypothetical protein ACLTJG_21240 [[Clostridium] innocuum]
MNPKFTPSKTVRDIIQFDKEHKQLRFLMDEEGHTLPEISSCSLKNQYYKKSSVSQLANLFTNNGILASENQELRVCIEVKLKDDTRVYGYVSKEIIRPNQTPYDEDVQTGRAILKLIRKVIAREQQAAA